MAPLVNSPSPFSQTLILPIPYSKSKSPPFSLTFLPHKLAKHLRAANLTLSHPSPEPTSLLPLFQKLGLPETHIQSLFSKNPNLLHQSPASITHIFNSLNSIGITDPSISRLIIKHPQILTSQKTDPILRFIQHTLQGIDPSKLDRLLLANDPESLSKLPEQITLLIDNGIPHDQLVPVLNKLDLGKLLHRSDRIIASLKFLEQIDTSVILRRPAFLNLDLETRLVPRARVLLELAGDDFDSVKSVLSKFPGILGYTVKNLELHVGFWRSLGFSKDEIFRVIQVLPSVFSISRERKLKPRIEFLKKCGLDKDGIFKFLIKAPLFLSLSFENNIRKKLGFLVKIGYGGYNRELVFAIGAATRTSSENMQMVISGFIGYGFCCEDLLVMSKKHPQVLQYNYRDLEVKIEYWVGEMGRDVGELMGFPAYLGYKFNDRIKLRYELKTKVEGERELEGVKCGSVNKLFSMSNERFLDKNSKLCDLQMQDL